MPKKWITSLLWNLLPILAGLEVSITRHFIAWRSYQWASFWQFCGSWFIHAIVVWFIIAIAHVAVKTVGKWFGADEKAVDVEHAAFIASLTILLLAGGFLAVNKPFHTIENSPSIMQHIDYP